VSVDVEIGDATMSLSPYEIGKLTESWKICRCVEIHAIVKRESLPCSYSLGNVIEFWSCEKSIVNQSPSVSAGILLNQKLPAI
jgi:hypothetical protein